MAKTGKILIWAGVILCACSTKYDEAEPDTELVVTIKNVTNAPLDNANVYVYDDLSVFNQTALTGVPAGFLAMSQTTQGAAIIKNLPFNKLLYVYASYQDTSIFHGTYITLDNSDENFIIENPLTRGSVTSLTITVGPADGFITFWTAN